MVVKTVWKVVPNKKKNNEKEISSFSVQKFFVLLCYEIHVHVSIYIIMVG